MTIGTKHLLAFLFGALLTAGSVEADVAKAKAHPSLFFGAEELAILGSRASDQPLARQALQKLGTALEEGTAASSPAQYAAAHALRFTLKAEPEDAQKALIGTRRALDELPEKDLPLTRNPEQLLSFCESAGALALSFDLCRPSWPDKEAAEVEDRLLALSKRLLSLGNERNRNTPGLTLAAGASSAGGLIALALRNETRSQDSALALARQARQQVSRFLEDSGERGWPREGLGAFRQVFRQGLGSFLLAWRRSQREDLFNLGKARGWSSLLPMLIIPPREGQADYPLSLPWYGGQALGKDGPNSHWIVDKGYGGELLLLLNLADAGTRGPLQWTFNRCFGPQGNQSLDLAKPADLVHLLLALQGSDSVMNPAVLNGHSWSDAGEGIFFFRNRWVDQDDALASIKANQQPSRTLRSFPDAGSFRLLALGGKWAVERNKDKNDTEALLRERENVVIIPGTHGWHAGKVLRSSVQPDGSGSVVLNLDKVYTVAPPGASPSLLENTQDLGIRMQRTWTIDYSGDCGAPVLLVIVDECRNGPTRRWLMHTEEHDISLRPDGFDIRAANGSTLRANFLAPDKPRLSIDRGLWTDTLAIDGEGSFFVVMTVQPAGAEHPKLEKKGRDLDTSISLGNTSIHYNDGDIGIR